LEEEYIGFFPPGQMMNNHLYGHISYNSSLSNAFMLKLGHNVKQCLVEMKATAGKDIVEHIIRLVKVIPASLVLTTITPLLIWIHTLWRVPMKIVEL
jgi:hypothetical protein